MGGSWNRNDVIIFGGTNGISSVSAAGGSPSLLTRPAPGMATVHATPVFLPDGQNFLYVVSGTPDIAGIYSGSLESKLGRLAKRLLAGPVTGFHVTSDSSGQGQLLFTREQVLMSQPFDIIRLEPAGEPRSLIEQAGSFAVSSNGILIWRAAEDSYTQPVWIDREGRKLAEVAESGEYPTFDLSRDSSRLVVSRRLQGRQNLWVIDLLRGYPRRLTLADVQHVDPRWSPDGAEVVFGSTEDPSRSPFRISLSDLKSQQVFKFEGGQLALDDWSPDGSHLLFHSTAASMSGSTPELWTLPLAGDKKPALVTRSLTGIIDQAQFSPDSNWVAYNTNESGRYEINVVRFPSGSDGLQVSTAGGVQPTWKGDGRELYFIAPDGNLMAVDVQLGATFKPGQPRSLFKTPLTAISYQMEQYHPSFDGKRFLFMVPSGGGPPSPFTVILNWTSLLKK